MLTFWGVVTAITVFGFGPQFNDRTLGFNMNRDEHD